MFLLVPATLRHIFFVVRKRTIEGSASPSVSTTTNDCGICFFSVENLVCLYTKRLRWWPCRGYIVADRTMLRKTLCIKYARSDDARISLTPRSSRGRSLSLSLTHSLFLSLSLSLPFLPLSWVQ